MLCEKCSAMVDLDNLMVDEGYTHHASYTSLVASARSGCELCQCIKAQQAVWAGGKLEDAYDQHMPAEDTQIRCRAFDRKDNVRGIRRIRIDQPLRRMRKHALGVEIPYQLAFLRLSTAASMQAIQILRCFTFSFAHR
jgi:hypothetical protein